MLELAHRKELESLAQLVGEVRAAAAGMDPLITGAVARDLVLHYMHGFPIERATTDADFAIAVADWDEFARVRDALLASGNFVTSRNATHKLRHSVFGWLDLIPFGAVESIDGTIAWPPGDDVVMAVIGYAEAASGAHIVALPGDQTARVVALPMLAVLKVLAWKDRHRSTRGKDAVDLLLILRRYLEAGHLARLYAEFPHIVDDHFDFEPTSAWLAGHDARAVLGRHSVRFDQVVGRLDAIIAPEIDADGALTLVLQLMPHDPDRALKLLTAFHAGLSGAKAP